MEPKDVRLDNYVDGDLSTFDETEFYKRNFSL